MWEQRSVVLLPQWLIVRTGSGLTEGATPAGMNPSSSHVTLQDACASVTASQCSGGVVKVGVVTGGAESVFAIGWPVGSWRRGFKNSLIIDCWFWFWFEFLGSSHTDVSQRKVQLSVSEI